ncbi:MAG: hypothetical protein EOM92_12440 [Gammaproteobacteria bacterium]|nr:hypothetical protein [Gammaproteobacteria bacterium]
MSQLAHERGALRLGPVPPARWLVRVTLCGALVLLLAGCQGLMPTQGETAIERLQVALADTIRPEATARERERAGADYRRALAAILPTALAGEAGPGLTLDAGDPPRRLIPADLALITPVTKSRSRTPDFTDLPDFTNATDSLDTPGLHRPGLGLPAVARIASEDPHAPRHGFQVPATLVALPDPADPSQMKLSLLDPRRVAEVDVAGRRLPVAMDLEAPLAAARNLGPGFFLGLRHLLRADRFEGYASIYFLEPYDPAKRPLVLVHGLMATPTAWNPLVRQLLADPCLRDRYQLWFFYYPTAQPIALSALQLREALDAAYRRYRVEQPLVLVGHSMGGILSRAQVSGLDRAAAEAVIPGVGGLPVDSPVRRALIFDPRRDVSRVVFLFTPHRGSQVASWNFSLWVSRLLRLPEWLRSGVTEALDTLDHDPAGLFPNSIRDLSPTSPFLRALSQTVPVVPVHSVIGDRGRRGPVAESSDGVVAFHSAHLPEADSEVVVPAGHRETSHPAVVAELTRILKAEVGGCGVPHRQ